MIKYILLNFLISLIVGCNINSKSTNHQSDIKSDNSKIKSNASMLAIESELLKKYETELKRNTKENEKKFIRGLINIVQEFHDRKLDTTILTIGNIKGDGKLDTIQSRVYLYNNSVFVHSFWLDKKDTIWQYKYSNPYVAFNSDLFQYDTRNTWVTFAVGILFGTPKINSLKEFDERVGSSLMKMICDYGISDLKKMKVIISIDDYKHFLKNYKGNLLEFGDPESSEGLSIWYKPANCFITYYRP